MSQSRLRSLTAVAHIIAVLLAFTAAPALRAQTPDFAIRYHERVGGLTVTDGRMRPQGLGGARALGPSLSFVAFGRPFDIDLRRNDRLTYSLDAKTLAQLDQVEVYEGELRNTPRSWVRLTRYRGEWNGVFSDGAELYAIEPYASAAAYLVTPDNTVGAAPIIYRFKDTAGGVIDEVAPVISQPGHASPEAAALANSPPTLLATGEQIDVGLVGDNAFGQKQNGMPPEAAMISMANVADGIFVTQVGVHLNVTQIESFANTPDPFDATDPGTLLAELANHKAATPTLSAEGLAHLFTGRAFQNTNVAGVAYLASICSATRSVGLTRVTNLGIGGLIAAHEIGHNFGAPHDGEPGSTCASAPSTYLMSPIFNGSHEFSTCSLQQMQPVIAIASCLYPLPPSDISLRDATASAQAVFLGMPFELELAVDNHGADAFDISASAVGDGAKIDWLSYSNCGYANPPACLVPSLRDGQSMSLFVMAVPERVGPTGIDVYVQSINDSNPLNNSYHVDVDVLPTVNLAVDAFDVSPLFPHPHDTVDVTVGVSNHGSVPATQVSAELGFGSELAVLSVAGPAGACTQLQSPVGTWTCPIGTLAPDTAQRVTAKVQDATGHLGTRYIYLFLLSAERNLGTGVASRAVNVQSALADLAVSIDSAALQGVPKGDRLQITLKGHNAGPDAADNVKLEFEDLDGVMAVDDVDANGAPCAPLSYNRSTTVCTFGTVAAGADFSATFSGTAQLLGGANVSVDVFSDAYDRNPADNNQSARVLVAQPTPQPTTPPPSSTPPPATSGGGGGGGAIDWLSAILLAAAVALVRYRRTSVQ